MLNKKKQLTLSEKQKKLNIILDKLQKKIKVHLNVYKERVSTRNKQYKKISRPTAIQKEQLKAQISDYNQKRLNLERTAERIGTLKANRTKSLVGSRVSRAESLMIDLRKSTECLPSINFLKKQINTIFKRKLFKTQNTMISAQGMEMLKDFRKRFDVRNPNALFSTKSKQSKVQK